MDSLLKKVEEEKTLKAESLVKLLRAVKASFPGLHLLLHNLEVKTNISDGKGMMATLNSRIWGLSEGNFQEVWMVFCTSLCSYNPNFMSGE